MGSREEQQVGELALEAVEGAQMVRIPEFRVERTGQRTEMVLLARKALLVGSAVGLEV